MYLSVCVCRSAYLHPIFDPKDIYIYTSGPKIIRSHEQTQNRVISYITFLQVRPYATKSVIWGQCQFCVLVKKKKSCLFVFVKCILSKEL